MFILNTGIFELIFHGVVSVPRNIVVDLNNVMKLMTQS